MTRVSKLAFVLVALGLMLAAPQAQAGPLGLMRGAREFLSHNARADVDERVGPIEFGRYARSGQLPAHVEPSAVLARKISRAEAALAQLRISTASKGRAVSIPAIEEMFSGTLANLNQVSRLVAEARDYAAARGLREDATPKIAREALAHGAPSLAGQSSFPGLGAHAVLVAGARQSVRDLTRVADRR